MNANGAGIQIEPYLDEISQASRRRDGEKNSDRFVLNPTSVHPPYRQLAAIQTRAKERALTTIRSGCCGSGSLFAFFAASCPASRPAFGFASFVPLRACCPVNPRPSVPPRHPTMNTRTASFLLSAASSAAWRGLGGMLSPPSACVVPISLWPPFSIPGFEQSAPIRVDDRERVT